MKAVRLLQIILLLAAGAYLVLLHDMNEVNVVLPFLFSLPPAVVLVLALGLGWLVGWLPSTARGMTRGRELRRLRRKVNELEQQNAVYVENGLETPVIPDRRPGETQEQEAFEGHENI